MIGAAAQIANLPAPPLREDLRLRPGAWLEAEREQSHLVYDPVAHRYHELDDQAFAILGHWRAGVPMGALAQELSQVLDAELTTEDLFELALSFDQVGLFSEPLRGWRVLHQERVKRRHGVFAWLLHNYLFIRIPLVRPDGFLRRTLPWARAIASRPVLVLIAVMGLAGLYLASRQWDAFASTFLFFLSFEGAAGYMAALVFVKVFHELGHAYAARHYGCRVPTMGVAFLVLAPVLYTDVTDAWRLASRRQRILITAAGMLTELALAAVALLLWALLPDGTLRSACFFVTTTSLVMSLVINLSPLMRFDGYYLLMDYWGISNLQPRSFALMRWWLREVLFDLRAPCPEDWPPGRRAAVILYAVIVCIYRLFLFIGIALLVYHLTFKILGILLFAVEIAWFVARPVWGEVRVWWRIRTRIVERRRYAVSLAAVATLTLLGVVPWPHRIEIPAVLEPVSVQRLVSPVAAQIKRIDVAVDMPVTAGQVLFELTSPKLDAEIVDTRTKLDLAILRRDRRAADQADRDASITLDQEIVSLREKLAGLRRLDQELTIRATGAGIVKDLPPDLHAQRWVGLGEELGLVVDPGGHQLRGYLPEEMVTAVSTGAGGLFIPDEPFSVSRTVRLDAIGASGVDALDLPYLASTYGGPVAVNEDKDKGSIPVEAQYQVVLATPQSVPASLSVLRGIVRLDATPDSFFTRIARRTLAVLIRESGF